MAVGFPTKVTYADGDVFSASDINDTNGTINLLTSSTLSSQAGKNIMINGGMDIWQRGTTGTATSGTAGQGYNADRWQNYSGSNAITVSRQATADSTNLPNIQYCGRIQRNSGQTSLNAINLVQNLESSNSIPFAGKTVVLSFYARKGANFSSTSNLLGATLWSGTGSDQSILAGYTGQAAVISQNSTLTSTWQRFTYSATVGATATQLGLVINYTPTGTASTNDYFEITGVQLELGSTATTFSRAGSGGIQGELGACMRYYQTSLPPGSITHSLTTSQVVNAQNTQFTSGIRFAVPMRVAPTVTVFGRNNNSGKISSINSGLDITGVAQANNIGVSQIWGIESVSTALTAGVGYEVSFNASAEL
jgi:hypothetical protein